MTATTRKVGKSTGQHKQHYDVGLSDFIELRHIANAVYKEKETHAYLLFQAVDHVIHYQLTA